MKKLLVVLLAVVMVFGFASSAMAADTLATAYPDLSGKTTTVQDAFMKLSALDVFGGYPDGTIKPDANITRAEFAKIACVVSGMADSADVLKGNASRFSDVPANQWYTGYVNLATSLQFVSGYPDGTYKPNSNITMQEALTVLLRISGYNDNLVGPWPLNYIAQGGKLDVTDDVAFAGAAPATRASIAVMASNLLDINVVYWDGDKTKFVEDTKKVDGDDVAISVLEDKFGAIVKNDIIVYGWGFDDFDDQELYLDYGADYYGMADLESDYDSTELAEKYWISNGQVINSLGNMQANLIMNGDKEVVYVDVTSTNLYSDDVTIDDGTLEVNGKTVKLVAGADFIDADGDDLDDDDYTAKVYYDEDGKVYLVQDVSELGFMPAIFESYNASKNRIDVYDAGKGNISVKDKDVAILKAGQFITTADLKDGDILNVFSTDKPNNADIVIIVTSFKEGELTKANSTKLTIDGSGLVWNNGADEPTYSAYYSDDAMDNFASLNDLELLDDAFGTTIKYAAALLNPYDLRLAVFEGGESTTLYGIITDIKANIDRQVSAITVLGADGEEVDYTLIKGDTNGRPEYVPFADLGTTEEDFYLTFGSYIKASVSEDGTIDTDSIAYIADPYSDNWGSLLAAGAVVEDLDTCEINSKRIKLGEDDGGVYYTLTADTLVFQTTTDDGFDEAEVVDIADLMAADEISGDVLAFVKDGVVKQLFLLDTDLTSTSNYGIIDSTEYRSGSWYATLLGGSEYKTSTNYAKYADRAFLAYTLSDGKLTTGDPSRIIWSDADDDIWASADALAVDEYLYEAYAVSASPTLIEGTDGYNYAIDDDTVFYTIEDGDFAEGDVYDIQTAGEDDATPLYIIADENDIALYVFVLIGYYFY